MIFKNLINKNDTKKVGSYSPHEINSLTTMLNLSTNRPNHDIKRNGILLNNSASNQKLRVLSRGLGLQYGLGCSGRGKIKVGMSRPRIRHTVINVSSNTKELRSLVTIKRIVNSMIVRFVGSMSLNMLLGQGYAKRITKYAPTGYAQSTYVYPRVER